MGLWLAQFSAQKPALPPVAHGGVDFSTCCQGCVPEFYNCGSRFLGCAVIGTSWEEERQLVSNDLTWGQGLLRVANTRQRFLGWQVPATPYLFSECWRSVGYSTGHQENSQEFSGVISIHENGSDFIFPVTTCTLVSSVEGSKWWFHHIPLLIHL